jgi:hypothetical protein
MQGTNPYPMERFRINAFFNAGAMFGVIDRNMALIQNDDKN